jgi:hypothetical protein
VAARCGTGGVCIPKLITMKEDFNSGLSASVWSYVDSFCAVRNGQLQCSSTANTTKYAFITGSGRYDLTDSEIRVELVDAGNQSLASFEAEVVSVCNFPSGSRCLTLLVSNGNATLQLKNGSNYTSLDSVPLSAWRILKLQEQGGTLFFEASTDGGSWAQLGSGPTPFISDFLDVNVTMGCGTFNPESVSSTCSYDNVNTP